MAGVKVIEDEFILSDGEAVYRKSWIPAEKPVAVLIHMHGFSEHINRYYEFFPTLAGRGIHCVGIDQRGWGRSAKRDSDRGNTGPTATILSDIASLVKTYLSPSEPPVFLMGHSMGGAEILTMASTPEYQQLVSQLSGIMLESPYIATLPEISPYYITVLLGRMVGALMPKFQIVRPLDYDRVVTDPAVQKDLSEDPLCHATGTLEMFRDMVQRASDLQSGKLVLNEGVKAIWLAHGTGDRTTWYEASREWYDREGIKVEDSEFKSYENWSHQLHIDTPEHRKIYVKDVGDWILKRAKV